MDAWRSKWLLVASGLNRYGEWIYYNAVIIIIIILINQ